MAILKNDIPALPEHWHAVCDCVPTVAYLRVSRVGKRTKIVSPKLQLNEIVADAKRNGRRIVKLLFDINKSGQDFDREAFGEVISDVKAGLYRHVSVWKWSRFGRTNRGSLRMLAVLEAADGVVDSATEPYDHDTVFGEFSRDQMILIADLQGKIYGETWRSVHETRLEVGLPHSGQKRFGYDYRTEDERTRRFEINPDEGRIIKWAVEQYVSGWSMTRIVNEVNAQGFLSPRGNPWTYAAWTAMLDNGFAAGLLRTRSKAMKKTLKRKTASRRTSYDVWTKGAQAAILDEALWQAYQKAREGGAGLAARWVRGVHELSALLFCGLCARRMATKYCGKDRQRRWICPAAHAYHPGKPVGVGNDEALVIIRDWLTERSQAEWIERESRRLFDEGKDARPEVDRIDSAIQKLQGQSKRALDLYLATDEENDAVRTRVLARLNSLEGELKELKETRVRLTADRKTPDWKALGVIVDRWDEFEPETHNAALRAALGMVVVNPASGPRVRRGVRDRVSIVPEWEMGDWAEWLSVRRQRSA